jgi:hypothetical protein
MVRCLPSDASYHTDQGPSTLYKFNTDFSGHWMQVTSKTLCYHALPSLFDDCLVVALCVTCSYFPSVLFLSLRAIMLFHLQVCVFDHCLVVALCVAFSFSPSVLFVLLQIVLFYLHAIIYVYFLVVFLLTGVGFVHNVMQLSVKIKWSDPCPRFFGHSEQ